MNRLSRRSFLKTSAAVSATTLPLFSIGRAGESANNKINVAVVGIGGMGGYAYRQSYKMENLVALCDVDFDRGGRALENHPNLPRFKDFRVMLDKMGDQIDAVAISTPDHTHFPARGKKPPVTLKWYERGYDVPKPDAWPSDKPLPEEGGMFMIGSKDTLMHPGMRPGSPRIVPDERRRELRDELKTIERLPSGGRGPIEEWFTAIKGGPAPGSPFDYAAPLTEMVLLGALAQRSGKTIEWDDANMKVKDQPELDSWIKEPVREGWEYGEDVL